MLYSATCHYLRIHDSRCRLARCRLCSISSRIPRPMRAFAANSLGFRFAVARPHAPRSRPTSRPLIPLDSRATTTLTPAYAGLSMTLPGAVEFSTDRITLAGDLAADDVARALREGGYKSWIYMNRESDKSFPYEAREALGDAFKNVIVEGSTLTRGLAKTLTEAMTALPRPTMVQCSTATRASTAYILFKAREQKWPQAGALQRAREMGLKFFAKPPLASFVSDGLKHSDGEVIFRQLFDTSGSSTYTYLLGDPISKEAVLIDPVKEMVERDLAVVNDLGLKLKYAINTHCHADHITGSGDLKKQLPELKSVIAKASGARADIHIEHGDVISFGDASNVINLEVRATPGHTDGCVSYVCENMVFTGDALLIRGCGRTDFQGGSSAKLFDAVREQLFTLPDETLVFPAHDYKGRMMSTIGEEKSLNPRLGVAKTKEEFIEIMDNLNLAYPKRIDVSLPANLKCGIDEDD